MTRTSFHMIDTDKPLRVTMSLLTPGDPRSAEELGEIKLEAREARNLIEGWLALSKKWRGTFNAALTQSEGNIVGVFDYEVFTRKLGCCGHPRTPQAEEVILKLWNWKSSAVVSCRDCASSDSQWYSKIRKAGRCCRFQLVGDDATAGKSKRIPSDEC